MRNPLARFTFGLGGIVVLQAALLVVATASTSPTLNEPSHLAAGLHTLSTGDFSLYRVNPPLVRTLAALPVAAAGYEADWTAIHEGPGARPVFEVGADFVSANQERTADLVRLGRLAVIPLTLLGTLICFHWARSLAGGRQAAGIIAASLWAFEPFVLGHGALLSPDAHASALGLAAGYTFWRWLRRPTWTETLISGLVLGLAESAKTTMIVLLPLWPVLWLVDRWHDRTGLTRRTLVREIGMLAFRGVLAVYVLNHAYLGQGFGTPLREYRFVSELFSGKEVELAKAEAGNRFEDWGIGWVPVPLPAPYVIGIDIQQSDFEAYGHRSYARGQWSDSGWWWYYLYVLLVKLPVGTLALLALATLTSIAQCITGRRGLGQTRTTSVGDQVILLAPAALIFAVASYKSGLNEHGRYILPCLPFLYVWMGAMLGGRNSVGAMKRPFVPRLRPRLRHTPRHLLAFSFLAVMIIESFLAWPHSIAFFNRAAGGPSAGPQHLLGSNVDWGQDLLRLNQWIDVHGGGQPVHLAYTEAMYDVFVIAHEDTQSWPLPGHGYPDGWYAISVGLLVQPNETVPRRDGQYVQPDPALLLRLRQVRPAARVGQTVRVFTADQVRAIAGENRVPLGKSTVPEGSALYSNPLNSNPLSAGKARMQTWHRQFTYSRNLTSHRRGHTNAGALL